MNNIANEVRWTKTILEEFISEGCMSEDDEKVLRMHCAGWSRVKIADNMSCSISTIDRTIARLKRKYDEVQRYDPILPPRQRFHERLPKADD